MAEERAFVGLGANLGDARSTLAAALESLARLPASRLLASSSLYASAPVDATGPDYLNAVAELQTGLEPVALLHALQAIEHQHGRERPFHHAPRTLDLDLLLFGNRLIDSAELNVPHPRLHQRAFVLQPLLELAPDLVHPRLGRLDRHLAATAAQAIRRLT